MDSWDKLPLELMNEFAERESYRRDVYRPIYSVHKWWARRPGSTFRMLSLAVLSGDDVTKDDILRENSSGSYDGMYLQNNSDEFRDANVIDPFAGGGTTVAEVNRLGADAIGYELNPVAWWTIKKATDSVELDALRDAFDKTLLDVQDRIGDYYKTIDHATGRDCEILYALQSQRIPCLTCEEEVNLIPRYVLAKNKKTSPAVLYCPNQDCDDHIIQLEEYWNYDGRNKEVRPLFESLARVPGGCLLDVAHLLPPFARKRIYTFPDAVGDPLATKRNCHWTALNFFNDPADDRFCDPQYVKQVLDRDYVKFEGSDRRLGDILVLFHPGGEALHSAVYVADDLVFTKNGGANTQPWIYMRLDDMLDYYTATCPPDNPPHMVTLRRKNL